MAQIIWEFPALIKWRIPWKSPYSPVHYTLLSNRILRWKPRNGTPGCIEFRDSLNASFLFFCLAYIMILSDIDEKAFYSMDGVSGHAGLFASASDVAKLASVMLSGGYGGNRYFSQNVIDLFAAPKMENAANWGLGWWRQGDGQRIWYFGSQAGSNTIGHQGWTGTLVMIDLQRNLVIAYLTNKINTRVTDLKENPNDFDGGWYTASTLGFVPQILSMGMDSDTDISGQLLDLSVDMALDSLKLIPEDLNKKARLAGTHPTVRNAQSKFELFTHMAEKSKDKAKADSLRESLRTAFDKAYVQLP